VATRANWHLDVELEDLPLTPSSTPTVERVGVEIDLLASPEDLERALSATIAEEGALWEQGISCELKTRPDMTCAVCPLRGTDVRRDLCEVGVRQERLLSRLTVVRDGG
jgi:hypothetical protein